ncbi:hypothetical protein [Treponema denticola]|uniref:hypothetical protein n=1 Tax=Treponema denticola TaxID=158 RepID=UPI002107B88D|nr:hypothetical protein [Treponema denticola]UTY27276.1 hypothetical protein E4N77_12035 [Treponema denticola]
MKNKKFFTAMLLLAVSALLFTSCALKMNTAQKAHYELFISGLENDAKDNPMPTHIVKQGLDAANAIAETLNFKIVDKKPGTEIATGTKVAELRKRFIPKKK